MFSNLLKKYREKHYLTQSAMIELIVSIDSVFCGLDEVTYSRWENGHTCPSIIKRCKILRRINATQELGLMLSEFNRKSHKFFNLVDIRFKYGYFGADSAYCDIGSDVYYTYSNKMTLDVYNELVGFQCKVFNIFRTYESLCTMLNEIFAIKGGANGLHIYQFKDKYGEKLGHFIFMNITLETMSNYFELPFNNADVPLSNKKEEIFFLVSDYALRKDITFFKFKLVRDYFVDFKINYYYARVYHQSIASILDKLNAKVVVKSPELVERGGVGYLRERYRWLGFLGDTDNFLVSDLSGNADEYTKDFNFIRVDYLK